MARCTYSTPDPARAAAIAATCGACEAPWLPRPTTKLERRRFELARVLCFLVDREDGMLVVEFVRLSKKLWLKVLFVDLL